MSKKREAPAPAETVREDFDPTEWGNIELPGLSDEELHGKNWNHITGMREFWNSDEGKLQRERYSKMTKQANAVRLSDPEYREKQAEISRQIAKNPDRNRKLSQSQKEYWNSEQGKKHRSELQQSNWEKHYETMAEAIRKSYRETDRGKRVSEALLNSDKCKANGLRQRNKIQTPDGVFNSRKEAAEYYGVHSTTMNTRMKNHPTEYYYIEVNNQATKKK